VQTTAAISGGSSGGGLFDEKGNLIGITTFRIRDAESLNFAISIDEYLRP
jgi:S1-C subfamily serine protease